ncbi:FadR/GntR family transcriptional regulator [Devosia rhodophyticola]|uniref:FadR/GntR family transcriptional regulator n=1 Tax=Devosia rhodophyticola TaxID=3026423 RepID=A0ABY7YVY3_9HYPH|nr:FadR/GntR family transcriptional regulator [Devosia rhodophyticola]WDR05215.1 FadR/GntR family transcriptional regulator [Devosia rhodophyticola]
MSETFFYDLIGSSSMVPSLSGQVVREIGRRIVGREYLPGDLIEDEGALATRYRVSRTVVREAVKILSAKGLVEARRGIGTKVLPRERWRHFDDDVLAWHQTAPADPVNLWQLMDLRLAIEPKAARWAADRATDEDVNAIREAVQQMQRDLTNIQDYIEADAQFHRTVLRAAKNPYVASMEGVIYAALLSSIRLTNNAPNKNRKSLPFHQNVAEAIYARDGDAAEAAMEVHLADSIARLKVALAERT